MIALDLCQPHYQVLLINYLKFTKNNAKNARKEKKTNQIIIECVGLRAKTYPYLMDDGNEHEKAKGT